MLAVSTGGRGMKVWGGELYTCTNPYCLVRPDSLQKLGYIVEFRGDIKADLCHGQDDDGVHLESDPYLCHWKAWKFQVFGIADLE